MANNKEKKGKDFVTILIEMFPSIVLSVIIIPLMGYLSYQSYLSDVVISSNGAYRAALTLIIILINLLILVALFYGINHLYKTDMKKFLLCGGVIIIFLVTMAIYRYSLYSELDVSGAEALVALADFKYARGILIGYVGYFLIMFPIDRIAKISIDNKKKTSK